MGWRKAEAIIGKKLADLQKGKDAVEIRCHELQVTQQEWSSFLLSALSDFELQSPVRKSRKIGSC